ncbi:MAG: hypothetical protein ACHQDE_03180, partial [Acidimicrobiia bacterium]
MSGPPRELDRRFEAFVFDWDGTAVVDRAADASRLRGIVEQLCESGAYVTVVSGTHLGNVDGQLRARPKPPGRLFFSLNRGSEVFAVDTDGPHLVSRREATQDEDAALDAAAALTAARLAARGLETEIVSRRLNRRKIDLIPLPEWSDPPKALIAQLLDAVELRLVEVGLSGLAAVVEIAMDAARESGLVDPRVTSDVKHVEIGLTDKSDAAAWIFRDLWTRGVGPGLVLVGGDEFGPLGGLPGSDSLMLVDDARGAVAVSVGVEPEGVPSDVHAIGGGPNAFVDVLCDQCARRAARDLPSVDERSDWCIVVEQFDTKRERADEARLTISDGWLATNGAPSLTHEAATPRTLVSGLYQGDGPEDALLPAPDWRHLEGSIPETVDVRRTLDLRTGVLREETTGDVTLSSLRFEPLDLPGIAVLRSARSPDAPDTEPLSPPEGGQPVDGGTIAGRMWMRVRGSRGGVVAAATQDIVSAADGSTRLDRVAAYEADPLEVPGPGGALERLDLAAAQGFEHLIVEHRARWASRWSNSDIVIEGDPELQQAMRFALFHLHGAAHDGGESAVGARGLTGSGYRGHVFWDADVFVLPFLAATRPAAARSMLEYRLRRLPEARSTAAAAGFEGARFPWESAQSGYDVTPSTARDRAGRAVPIRTGQLEDHVVADVAWA